MPMFDIDRFIDLIRERQVLWDKKTGDLTNRELAWIEIGEALYKDWLQQSLVERENKVKMMKSKWRHLRDNYLRSIKVGTNKKRYVYAQQLNFLHDTFGSRATSLKKSTGSDVLIDLATKIQSDQQNAYTNGHMDSGSEIRSDNYEANESCSSDAVDDTYQPPSKRGHYTKLPTVSPKLPTIRPKLPTLEPTIPTTKHVEASQVDEEDADLMFFNSILPDYKELDEEEKLDFRIKCLQFIRDTRKSRKS